ncbi:hypothetical protein NVP1161O_059 [Vibrio phage 1.161.O._10N.261.48.C5]|nr:hypothetical protein NVP1161O_059 [Vibrio phage 1.161.O._10N.261.48.C5]
MKLTKIQQEFIGSVFKTPKGGILTVTSLKEKLPKKDAIFFIHCSICSEDKELFPNYSLFSTKSNLKSGRIPCGCSLKPAWSKSQYETLILRIAKSKGYIFEGFLEWKAQSTKIRLYNPDTGNVWDSCSIAMFINRKSGDPSELASKISRSNRLPDEEHIESFKSHGKYHRDCKFRRSERLSSQGYKIYWDMYCPVCKGWFTSKISHLKEGNVGCDCYTPDSPRFNGFDSSKAEEVDLLYILSFKGAYSKCGRAFNLNNRFKQSRGIIKMSGYPREDIEVAAVYTGTHQQVWDTEQWLLKETKDRGFYYNSGWTTESRTMDAIPLLIKLVEEHSDLTKVDYVEGM